MRRALRPLVIYGAGGHGRETAWLATQINTARARYRLLGFLDDAPERHGTPCGALAVLGGLETLETLRQRHGELYVALGVGSPAVKRRLLGALPSGCHAETLIHPGVVLAPDVRLGSGVQLHAGVIVTVNVTVGHAVTVNRRVDLSHDCRIGDFATLAPAVSLAGDVCIGDDVQLGIGARCIPGVRIGEGAVVGAGAVVISDLPAQCTAVGVPARVRSLHSANPVFLQNR